MAATMATMIHFIGQGWRWLGAADMKGSREMDDGQKWQCLKYGFAALGLHGSEVERPGAAGVPPVSEPLRVGRPRSQGNHVATRLTRSCCPRCQGITLRAGRPRSQEIGVRIE